MSPGLALRQVGLRGSSAGGFHCAGLARREAGWIVLRWARIAQADSGARQLAGTAPVTGRDGSGQTGDAVPVGAFGGPAVAAHAGRFFVDGFPLMRSGARTPLRLRPYCDSGAVGFLLRLPHTRSVGPASLRRRGWAGAVWCGWGSQDGPGRGRVQICCKGAPDRDRPRMKARNSNDSPPALRRDRGLCNRFGQPTLRWIERAPRTPAPMGRMGLVGHPGRSGEARNRGRHPRPPTTAPGPRGRPGAVAQGPGRAGPRPPVDRRHPRLVPCSCPTPTTEKRGPHDTAVSGLPQRPVPPPRLTPQDQEPP